MSQQSELRYFAARFNNAESMARHLRMTKGFNANVYQHDFVIVGPQSRDPSISLPFPLTSIYTGIYYEDCLMALLKGENHKVPTY